MPASESPRKWFPSVFSTWSFQKRTRVNKSASPPGAMEERRKRAPLFRRASLELPAWMYLSDIGKSGELRGGQGEGGREGDSSRSGKEGSGEGKKGGRRLHWRRGSLELISPVSVVEVREGEREGWKEFKGGKERVRRKGRARSISSLDFLWRRGEKEGAMVAEQESFESSLDWSRTATEVSRDTEGFSADLGSVTVAPSVLPSHFTEGNCKGVLVIELGDVGSNVHGEGGEREADSAVESGRWWGGGGGGGSSGWFFMPRIRRTSLEGPLRVMADRSGSGRTPESKAKRSKNRRRSVDNSMLLEGIRAGGKRFFFDMLSPGNSGTTPSPTGGKPSITTPSPKEGGRKNRWGGMLRTSSVEALPSFDGSEGRREGGGGKVGAAGGNAGVGEGGKAKRKLLRRWSLSSLQIPSTMASTEAAATEASAGGGGGGGGEEGQQLQDAPVKKAERPKILFHMVNVLRRPMVDIGEDYVVLGEELGRGKYGVIHKVVFKATSKAFACKTIRKEQLVKWQHIEDVRTEVEILETLRGHPHIAHLRGSYEDAEAIHMVMDLCEGGELFERIKMHGKYSERRAAVICRTLAEVLVVLKKEGITHRDLKPENILLCSKDSLTAIKVIDFGLATYYKESDEQAEIVGTPSYCSPEALESGTYGPESDVWSLGIILYILLSGIPPFCASSIEEILRTITGDFLDLNEGLWLEISPEARDLIRKMLRVSPKNRITPRGILAHPWIQKNTQLPAAHSLDKNHETKQTSRELIMASLLK